MCSFQINNLFRPIHGYLLNELNCAIMYPNVRGSSGYGKRYMALDDVEKREDSVKFVTHFSISMDISSLPFLDKGILGLSLNTSRRTWSTR